MQLPRCGRAGTTRRAPLRRVRARRVTTADDLARVDESQRAILAQPSQDGRHVTLAQHLLTEFGPLRVEVFQAVESDLVYRCGREIGRRLTANRFGVRLGPDPGRRESPRARRRARDRRAAVVRNALSRAIAGRTDSSTSFLVEPKNDSASTSGPTAGLASVSSSRASSRCPFSWSSERVTPTRVDSRPSFAAWRSAR